VAYQLSDVITAARDRHPAFHKTRVTDAVLARFLTDYQNALIAKCLQRDSHYLEQSVGIAFSLDTANAPGTVGAGTSGGLPGAVSGAGALSAINETAGSLVASETTTAEGATVWVAERAATAATANTISSTGAGRTTNQDAGRLVVITAGKGTGQRREVASNTADQWTTTQNWETTPDTTSLFQIVTPVLEVENEALVVTDLPALSDRVGYLVRLNAQGTPYIDYTKPLVASIEKGVPLPSITAISGGTVRYTDGDTDPLAIVNYRHRFDPPRFPAVWQAGETLFFCGDTADWVEVASIEVRYSPVAPKFTALTDYFLLPDASRPAVVERAAALAALRVAGTEGIEIDPELFRASAERAEQAYLSSLRLSKRSRISVIREGVY
jgi:hypothetical protein